MSTRVPQSAADATLFTSTNPHATSKPFPLPSSNPAPSARKVFEQNQNAFSKRKQSPRAPSEENPQEKVKRLRAALDKARAAQVSPLEKLIVRGRVWADRAHRITASGLMGFTVLAGLVTTYALIDMAVHNRRKKHAYFMEKKAAYLAALVVSRRAIETGIANEAQIDLVEYDDAETARQEKIAQDEAAKKGRWWRKTKDFLFLGLKKEEEEDAIMTKFVGPGGFQERVESVRGTGGREKSNLQETARLAFAEEKERQRMGGALDRMGTDTSLKEATKMPESESKGSWWTRLIPER